MSSNSALLLKMLINRFHPDAKDQFLKPLPADEAKKVAAVHTASTDIAGLLFLRHDLIKMMHYSWLVPLLESSPKAMQKIVLSSLPESQASGLRKLLKIEKTAAPLAAPIQQFVFNHFCSSWDVQGVLPRSSLPETALSPLLDLSKKELITLVDYLALYDVAEAVRHIVDTNKLKLVYRCLTHDEQKFLRICLHKTERVIAHKLDIHKWDGDPDKLRFILHRRGLFRLGKALCSQSRDFLWYIVHTLDIGRGKVVEDLYEDKQMAGITPFLMQQVTKVIDFIKKKS